MYNKEQLYIIIQYSMFNIPKIIFLVPFRNRDNEKFAYLSIMKSILEDYDNNYYKIYFIKQLDNRMFNRGAIKNIGFNVIKNVYPNDYKNITLVFNDIDVCPLDKSYIKDYSTTVGKIKHFYGFTFALGGIVSITGEDFEKIGGFINNWGWGFEDNHLNNIAKIYNIVIDRSVFYEKGSKKMLDIYHGKDKYMNNSEIKKAVRKINGYDNLKTLRNINYTIENENYFNWNNKNTIYNVNVNKFDTLINFSNIKNDYRIHDLNNGNKVYERNIGLKMKFV